MRRWGWVCALAITVVAVYWGCSPTSDQGGDGIRVDRTTPDRLLKFFALAYEDEDIDNYDDALDEKFLFQFTPDVADSLGLPADEPWWGKVEDYTSTQNMFNSSEVSKVEMDYVYRIDWYTCVEYRVENGDTNAYSGLQCQLEPDIKVHIERSGEEPLILWVNQSYLTVTVVPDRDIPDQWKIFRMQEESQTTPGMAAKAVK